MPIELNELLAGAAKKSAAIKNLGPMCNDCAFKIQPDINGYSAAVDSAAQCLAYYGTFCCHTPGYQNTNKVCIGFLYAIQYFETLNKEES